MTSKPKLDEFLNRRYDGSISNKNEQANFDNRKTWKLLRRYWLNVSVIFFSTTFIITVIPFFKDSIYEAEGTILIKNESVAPAVTEIGRETSEVEPLTRNTVPLDTEAAKIRSLPVVQRTIQQLDLRGPAGQYLRPKEFLNSLSVESIKGSDILSITFQGTSPEMTAKVVNTIMSNYLDHSNYVIQSETIKSRQFIEKKLPEAKSKVIFLEEKLQNFKEANNLFDPKKEEEVTIENIVSLQKQIAQAKVQMASAKTRSSELLRQLGLKDSESALLTNLSQTPEVQEVLKDLNRTEAKLAIARTRVTSFHPLINELEEQTKTLKSTLSRQVNLALGPLNGKILNLRVSELQKDLTEQLIELESVYLASSQQVKTLSNIQINYRQRAQMLPRLDRQMRTIQRDLKIADSIYTSLLLKLQNLQVAEEQNTVNAHIISQALAPEDPIAPVKSLYLLSGIFLGGIFSGLTICFYEIRGRFNKIYTDEFVSINIVPETDRINTED